VSIRRDDNDFVIVFQPEDLVAFRNASATALRKVCHFIQWEVVNDTVPEAGDPGSWEWDCVSRRMAQFSIWRGRQQTNCVPPVFTPCAVAVPVDIQNAVIQIDKMVLEALQRSLGSFRQGDLTIVKTLLNNLWAHIGYEDDGYLVHTDKRTGKQKISVKTWPSLVSARQALAAGLSKIEWEELNEPPPAA
jgi:hypothetical protein